MAGLLGEKEETKFPLPLSMVKLFFSTLTLDCLVWLRWYGRICDRPVPEVSWRFFQAEFTSGIPSGIPVLWQTQPGWLWFFCSSLANSN